MADVHIPPEENDDDVHCTISDSSGEGKLDCTAVKKESGEAFPCAREISQVARPLNPLRNTGTRKKSPRMVPIQYELPCQLYWCAAGNVASKLRALTRHILR